MKSPNIKELIIVNNKYIIKFLVPSTIFNAPRLVIFVAGPVIINNVPVPKLIPRFNQS